MVMTNKLEKGWAGQPQLSSFFPPFIAEIKSVKNQVWSKTFFLHFSKAFLF